MNEDRNTWPYNSSSDSGNLRKKWMTESLDELHKWHKGFNFWVCNFYGFIFWVRNFYGFIVLGPILPGIYFFGCHEKCLGQAPPIIFILEYTP